ncbi:MAG: Trk system potassium transporter TrkA [Flavobacteriales bacterium]|nr:Trk system potassium transporter TrkA [Flavobacteriales bacterium]
MKIVIAGAGEVGIHLAKLLSDEHQDITLIDLNKQKLKYAESHTDVMILRGDATSVAILDEARIQHCDLLITATDSETTNMLVAMLGKKLGAKRTIARISNTEHIKNYGRLGLENLGLDSLISPEKLAVEEIAFLVKQSAFTDAFEFEGGKLSLIGIQMGKDAPILNKTIKQAADLNPDLNFMLIAINRMNVTIIPRGDTLINEGDDCYFIAQKHGIKRLLTLTGNETVDFRNVMILGGSTIGVKTAKALCKEYKVKLIESDKEKAFELADELENVLVIKGDGRDAELLQEENIDQMGVFIAVTGNSETNIMSCLVAKAHGVYKTIALVENMEYIHLSKSVGIDAFINKKLIAASNIYQYIRKGKVVNSTMIRGLDSQILEYEVKAGSKITKKPIYKLGFPHSAVIGGAIRNGKALITKGDFQAEADDKVIVFCLPGAAQKVESFFK